MMQVEMVVVVTATATWRVPLGATGFGSGLRRGPLRALGAEEKKKKKSICKNVSYS